MFCSNKLRSRLMLVDIVKEVAIMGLNFKIQLNFEDFAKSLFFLKLKKPHRCTNPNAHSTFSKRMKAMENQPQLSYRKPN